MKRGDIMDKNILRKAVLRHPSAILRPYDVLMGLEGFDAIYALCENIGGATVYVPSMRKMFAGCVAKEAMSEFNGYNIDALAQKYGYSNRHIRRMLHMAV